MRPNVCVSVTYYKSHNLCLCNFESINFQIGNGVSEDDVIGARYQFSLLKHALKPMSMAEKVSIRSVH